MLILISLCRSPCVMFFPNLIIRFLQNHTSEMFAFHATMMSNTLGTSIVVFTRTGFMAILLSHYRPSGTIFAFTNEFVFGLHWLLSNLSKSFKFFKFLYLNCRERVRQRLALYQGVCPIYMEFLDDAEESFAAALAYLKVTGYPALSFCF